MLTYGIVGVIFGIIGMLLTSRLPEFGREDEPYRSATPLNISSDILLPGTGCLLFIFNIVFKIMILISTIIIVSDLINRHISK